MSDKDSEPWLKSDTDRSSNQKEMARLAKKTEQFQGTAKETFDKSQITSMKPEPEEVDPAGTANDPGEAIPNRRWKKAEKLAVGESRYETQG